MTKSTLIFLIGSLICFPFLAAQQSVSLIYQLSDEQISSYLTDRYPFRIENPAAPPSKNHILLRQPIDTLSADEDLDKEKLPFGTFVRATVQHMEIHYKLIVHSQIIGIQTLVGKGENWIYIQTAANVPVEAVFLNQRKLSFDTQKGAFRLQGNFKKAILQIQTTAENRFFFLNHNRLTYQQEMIQSAGDDDFSDYHQRKKPKFTGYMALSQPIYRPGDSLKLKVLIYTRKGRPLTKEIRLYTRDRSKTKTLATLQPQRPGLYLFEKVLDDSMNLRLDTYHALHVSLGEDKYLIPSNSFRYEAYELDESKVRLWVEADELTVNDSLRIYASITDANGMSLPGGKLILSSEREDISDASQQRSYIPWKWLQDTFAVKNDGKPLAVIPLAQFQNLELSYKLNGTFLTSNN